MKKSLLFVTLLLVAACTTEEDAVPENTSVVTSSSDVRASESSEDAPQYHVSRMTIVTQRGQGIWSEEKTDYQPCTVTVESDNEEWNYEGTARVRGRGNSTWLWYDKKPYRLKLDKKHKMLGLASDKDWVLLANYRDPTDMMNTFVFIMGDGQGIAYPNHSRFVELILDGDYLGLYQLTEQVETGKNRVNIDEKEGCLISLDKDDGPELAPYETDNFWSKVYRLPVCVKTPDSVSAQQKRTIREDFAQLENAVKQHDLATVEQLMDVDSYIEYMLIQELVYNVEVDAPRSIFMFKDVGGRWTMGPLWDFDAGYDFDWATMYTGHKFFTSYKELVLGTDPARHIGGYHVNSFFTDLWKSPQFVTRLVDHWKALKPLVMSKYWQETLRYYNGASEALERDYARWPIDKRYDIEIAKMERWLALRVSYLDQVISKYPGAATSIAPVKM